MVERRNGIDGWELVEYSWDPDTGIAMFLYEHETSTDAHPITWTQHRAQPAEPKHTGWYMK